MGGRREETYGNLVDEHGIRQRRVKEIGGLEDACVQQCTVES